ncbi:MAG: hypothetical protein ACI90V_006295 [Bacillariaceae sp.]|jgi:hypothetical protein
MKNKVCNHRYTDSSFNFFGLNFCLFDLHFYRIVSYRIVSYRIDREMLMNRCYLIVRGRTTDPIDSRIYYIVFIVITDDPLELFRTVRPWKLFLPTSVNNLKRVIINTIQNDLRSMMGMSKRTGRRVTNIFIQIILVAII